jgi:hypothetical protein
MGRKQGGAQVAFDAKNVLRNYRYGRYVAELSHPTAKQKREVREQAIRHARAVEKVRGVCRRAARIAEANGIPSRDVLGYVSFAQRVQRLAGKYWCLALAGELRLALALWQGRGLAQQVLEKITAAIAGFVPGPENERPCGCCRQKRLCRKVPEFL